MNRTQGNKLAGLIADRDYEGAHAFINEILAGTDKINWHRDLRKLQEFIKDGNTRFSIFAKDGNGKLPFVAFSSLPGKRFCVGAGPCLEFCYSFKAWRYPAAFARQCQNAILLQSETGRKTLLDALDEFQPQDGAIDFRLYVDGDFTGIDDIAFWMEALTDRQWLRAYGYSKSWQSFLDYTGTVPSNYQLNLSSGSKYGDIIKDTLKKLSYVRGEFLAVSLGAKVKSTDHGQREHNVKLREAYGKKAFTCPGKCGSCTKGGHACGSERFKGIDIIIAVH